MVKVNLVDRTVTNTGDVERTLLELIEKKTVLAPGEIANLDPSTKIFEI